MKKLKAAKTASERIKGCICAEYDGKGLSVCGVLCPVHSKQAEHEAQRNRDAMLGQAVRHLVDMLMPLLSTARQQDIAGNMRLWTMWHQASATSGYIAPAPIVR